MDYKQGLKAFRGLFPDINPITVAMQEVVMANKFIISPTDFDDELEKLGYDIEKDGSINDYVLKKYGQKAVDFINN